MLRVSTLLAAAALAASTLLGACGSNCELGEQEALWKDIAPVAEGSFMCSASSTPYNCKVGDKGCNPTLHVLHAEGDEASHQTKVKSFLEGKGWKLDAAKSKGFEDGSQAMHFVSGGDEIIAAVGKLGAKQVEITLMRKPQ